MRTNYATLSLLLLCCLVGCNNNDSLIDLTPANQIGISVSYDEAFTRGTPLTDSNQLSDMGVFGYYTGVGTDNWSSNGSTATPNFMNNQKVVNQGVGSGGNYWQYSPAQYWPPQQDANISFFAYSPYATSTNGISIASTTGGISLNYNVPTECANQPDLVLAVPQTDLNITHEGDVNFQMQHALTCIGFSAIGSGISITSIQLNNISTSGQVTVDPTTGNLSWTIGATQSSFQAIPNNVTLQETLQSIISSNGFLMMVPQTLGSNAKLVVTDSGGGTTTFNLAGQVWEAGQKINYNLNLNQDPASITIDELPDAFVGAFWRYNETGERIIRMNNLGAWEVSILATDNNWSRSNIMLDSLPSSYSTTMGVAISGAIQQMTSSKSTLSGTGNISFRVGLTADSKIPSSTSKPRYAILLVKHTRLTKNHLIFLRQGEAPDLVNGSAPFSPFNLDASKGIGLFGNTYNMVDYPTQSGGFKRWSTSNNMYSPYGTLLVIGIPGSTSSIANVCPTGYIIPSATDFRDMLSSTGNTISQCAIGGLYADGFYDRARISISNSSSGNTFQVSTGDNVAYDGFIVYNIKTYASVFFPQGGRRIDVALLSTPTDAGSTAYYWSSTKDRYSNYPYCLLGQHNQSSNQKVNASVNNGYVATQSFCIRPISTQPISSSEDVDGSLDGFADEEGWN